MDFDSRHKTVLLIPLYNPENGWEKIFLSGYQNFCNLYGSSMPVIISNDGSSIDLNDSFSYLRKNLGADLHILDHTLNKGKGSALKKAAGHLEAEHYIFTDHDFPYTIESMVDVLNKQLIFNGITMGVRNDLYYQDMSAFRKFISKFLKKLNLFLLKLPSNDTQCGLKAFDAQAKKILLSCNVDRFLIDLEFLLSAQKKGIKITPVEVYLRDQVQFSTFNFMLIMKEIFLFLELLWKFRLK